MTSNRFKPLLDPDFLKAELGYEFQDYEAAGYDQTLRDRLLGWARRELKRETQAERSFIQRFFVDTWGYRDDGVGAQTFHLWPKFPIAGAGQTGGRGEADLAVGAFGEGRPEIPQIVCEFKDVRSGLDKPQNRKGNTRSPVYQARDYLWNARRGLFGNEPVQPRFAVVTDMDEFRLYWWDAFPDRSLRFRITPGDLFDTTPSLLGNDEESRFIRFLFWRLFRPDMLLSDAGRPRLERLIERQGKEERKLEDDFYENYRNYRRVLINQIVPQRPGHMTKGAAVRLAQKLLDRLIFLMFAEDMGARIGFPVNALVDQLRRFSEDPLLEASGDEVWRRIRQIFGRMNTGGDLGGSTIHQFNGGLFADDPDLDGLRLPNSIFVRRGQARSDANIAEHKDTLMFLAATYNYAREGGTRNSIGLYTLGHIFEQSIVELEKLEADADERPSIAELSKRKLDGVYYTPEWVVRRIVEETLDPLFERWRADAGWREGEQPTREAAAAYWDRLKRIKVIDPACGSGAFLIVALRHLEKEFAAAVEAGRETSAIAAPPDASQITRMILADNLYGVDLNPASVEITQLSLWLHTAEPNQPLSGLEDTIKSGNSLVDKRFYNKRRLYDAEEKDRINTFEWEGRFAAGSFDAVIGNPPYVKLQNFVQVNPDVADWLVHGSTGEAPYLSTTTGNFDLYLPFIEKGLELLDEGGRLGFIAPSLWPRLENGAALRRLIHAGRHLEKWLDFRSFQVFDDVTVYTAIQIFSKAPVESLQLAFAPDGDVSKVHWTDAQMMLPYNEIATPAEAWLMAPSPVRSMVLRLGREGPPLGHPENSKGIIVGIQTSADHIYHLRRVGKNRYAYRPKQEGRRLPEVAVEIEDEIMKPLVSGSHVKRFIEPSTDVHLLFPYAIDVSGARLLTPAEMEKRFPKAWKYLKGFENELRSRERGAFDDNQWYRMGRNQNPDKQEVPKLLVPRLVARLQCFADERGQFYCDNVDVGGVVPPRVDDIWWLAGILNAPVTNTIFGWLSKPFRGEYKSANKQFIAPLPIPRPRREDKIGLSALARQMQQNATLRVALRDRLEERLGATSRPPLPLERMLVDVRSIPDIEAEMPRSVPGSKRKAWVDDQRKADEESALASIEGIIHPASEADVRLSDGKLAFLIDEQEVARLFVSPGQEALGEAQWRAAAVEFEPAGKDSAKRLIERLRRVALTADRAVEEQIVAIGKKMAQVSRVLREDEEQLHEMTCYLFNLSDEERRLVERARL